MDEDDYIEAFCAICGGPLSRAKVRGDDQDPSHDGFDQNVIQQQDLEWLRQIHLLCIVALPNTGSRFHMSGAGTYDPRTGFVVEPGDDHAFSDTESRKNAYPFHWPCYEILARCLTGYPDPASLDKSALYRAFRRLYVDCYRFKLDFGDAHVAWDKEWMSVPGKEYTVTNPTPQQSITREVVDFIKSQRFEFKASDLGVDPEAESNPLNKFPETLIHSIIELLDNTSLLNLIRASRSTFLMLHGNQRFWKSQILKSLPYFFELIEALRDGEVPLKIQDLHRIMLWADEACKPRAGMTGPLMAVANRRRIWKVCEQIQNQYNLEPVQRFPQTSNLEPFSFCNKLHTVGTPPYNRDIRESLWLQDWSDLHRSWTLEAFWNSDWTLSGIGVTYGTNQIRILGYQPNEKGSWRTKERLSPNVWVRGFVFHIILGRHSYREDSYVKGFTVYLTDGTQRTFGQNDTGLAKMPVFAAPDMVILGIRGVFMEYPEDDASPKMVSFGLLQIPVNGDDRPASYPQPEVHEGVCWKGETWYLDKLISGSNEIKTTTRDISRRAFQTRSLVPFNTLSLAYHPNDLSRIRGISAYIVPLKSTVKVAEGEVFDLEVCNLRVSTDDGQRLLRNVDDYYGTPWLKDYWVDFVIDGPGGEVVQEVSIMGGSKRPKMPPTIELRTNYNRSIVWGGMVLADDQGLPSCTPYTSVGRRRPMNKMKAEDGFSILGITMAFGIAKEEYHPWEQIEPWTEEEFKTRQQSLLYTSISSVGIVVGK